MAHSETGGRHNYLSMFQAGEHLLLAGFGEAGLPDNEPQLSTAIAVGWAESHGDAHAEHVNRDGSIDRGFMQINSRNNNSTAMYNPQACSDAAYQVWSRQGWGAWTTYRTKEYLAYLPAAKVAAARVARKFRATSKQAQKHLHDEYGIGNPNGFGHGFGDVPGAVAGPVLGGAFGIAHGAGQAWDAAKSPLLLAKKIGEFLFENNGAVRILEVGVGVIFLLGGVFILARELNAQPVAKLAGKGLAGMGVK